VARHADAARMQAIAADARATSAAKEAWRRLEQLDRVGLRARALADKRG
jgi:hypothetical protein